MSETEYSTTGSEWPDLATQAAQRPSRAKAKSKTGAQKRRERKERAKEEAQAEGAPDEYDPTTDPDNKEYVFKGQAVLLTWQLTENADLHAIQAFFGVAGATDKVPRTLVDSTKASEKVRDHLQYWTFCTERGTHLHAHGYLQFNRKVEIKRNELMLPSHLATGINIMPNKARGAAFGTYTKRGHFYAFCRYKTTHIDSASNYLPGHDYKVCLNWIDDLWCEQKIERALECALEYRVCTPQFEARYKKVMAARGATAREEFHKNREAVLAARTKPFKKIPVVEAWLSTFQEIDFRYKFLCLYGPSRMGKTTYAASLFKKPFVAENAFSFDGYSPLEHDGIILEDVPGIWACVDNHKRFFQSNTVVTLQSSQTNCYTIKVDTAQVPIVICCNENTTPVPFHDAWVAANMVAVNITEPTWQEADTPIVLDSVAVGEARLEYRDERPPPAAKRPRYMPREDLAALEGTVFGQISPPPGLVGPNGFTNC